MGGISNGTKTLAFSYNDDGLRTEKTVTEGSTTTTHEYIYTGGKLEADVIDGDALYFHRDQNGEVIGFTHSANGTDTEYYYRKNLQGDILGIVNSGGTEVATYSYDAWGNILSVSGSNTSLANRNPLRYRGYMYDNESGLYYLKNRYYDPRLERFVNPDRYTLVLELSGGANMFVYCLNNPIVFSDENGNRPTVELNPQEDKPEDLSRYYIEKRIEYIIARASGVTGFVYGGMWGSGLGVGVQGAIVFDNHENVALAGTLSYGFAFGKSRAMGVVVYPDAEYVWDLEGKGFSMGASIYTVGVEFSGEDSLDSGTLSWSRESGYEIHYFETQTSIIMLKGDRHT